MPVNAETPVSLFAAIALAEIWRATALVLVILVQRPQGGGLASAFGGGGGTDTAFGGRTGDALTVATVAAVVLGLVEVLAQPTTSAAKARAAIRRFTEGLLQVATV